MFINGNFTRFRKQELKNYYEHAINAADYWAQKRKEHDKHEEILTNTCQGTT